MVDLPAARKQSKNSNAGRGGFRAGAGRKPGAVSQAKRDLMAIAKEHAEGALETLVSIHQNAKAPAAARVSAAVAILDRGYGKPTQAVAVGNPDGSSIGPSIIQIVGMAAQHDDGAGQTST